MSLSRGVSFAAALLVAGASCVSCAAAPTARAALECPAPAPCPPPPVQREAIAWTGPGWFEPCSEHMRTLSHFFTRAETRYSVRAYLEGLRVFVEALTTAVEIDETATPADKQDLLASCAKQLDELTDIFRPISPPAHCKACRLETTTGAGVVSLEAPLYIRERGSGTSRRSTVKTPEGREMASPLASLAPWRFVSHGTPLGPRGHDREGPPPLDPPWEYGGRLRRGESAAMPHPCATP